MADGTADLDQVDVTETENPIVGGSSRLL